MSKNNEISPWPKEGAKLFVEDGRNDELAAIGHGPVPMQFSSYIDGYKEVADLLVDEVINSKSIYRCNTYTAPIIFLYRQYLELVMKNLYLQYSGDSKEEKKKTINKMQHDLLKLWGKVKPVITRCCNNASDEQDVAVVEDYIKQFHECDEKSLSFRYPITKNLEIIHKSRMLINLQNLRDRMNELHAFFIGYEMELSEDWK